MEEQPNPNTSLANGGGDTIGLAYYFGTPRLSLLPHGVAPPSSNVPSIVSSDTHRLRQHARYGTKQSHHMGCGGRGRCQGAAGGNIRRGEASEGGRHPTVARGRPTTAAAKAPRHASRAMRGHATCHAWPRDVPMACMGAACCMPWCPMLLTTCPPYNSILSNPLSDRRKHWKF